MTGWCRQVADGTWRLSIRVQPGAKRTEVAGVQGEALKIRIAAPAVEERANEALIDFLAAHLGVRKRDLAIVSGARSRNKRLEIRSPRVDPADLLRGA